MAGGAYSAHRWSSYRHCLHREMIYITFRCQGRSVLKLAFNLGSLVDPLVLEPIGSCEIIEEVPNAVRIEVLGLETIEFNGFEEARFLCSSLVGGGSLALLLQLVLKLLGLHY